MSSKRYRKMKETFSNIDNSWEEEIERLKYDIKRAEKKILMSDQNKFTEKEKVTERYDRSDVPVKSSNLMDLYSSPEVERVISSRILSDAHNNPVGPIHKDVLHLPKKTFNESNSIKWVSPAVSKMPPSKGDIFPDPFSHRLESSFDIDCGSSIISLDFGLVSPKRNWCSPPQRIDRAQNKEWSSPHRVIDRPNPENSPGNWISMKESCLTLGHSPTLGIKSESVEILQICPEPGPRPVSQSTYVVPETMRSQETHPEEIQPTRKISVLEDYEPERIVSNKKRPGGSTDATDSNFLPKSDKIRRIVDPSGHVIKISLLDDFEAPVLGKTHDKKPEVVEKEIKESAEKLTRGTTNKVIKISTRLSPSALKPQAKKKKEEDKTSTRNQREIKANIIEEKNKAKEDERNEEKEDINKSTRKMIEDLEEILRPANEENEISSAKEKIKEEKTKTKKFKSPKLIEERPVETPEKRKRNVDPKAVQEYMKNQKQKRMELVKTEKKTKDAEREARKKKLEELRIKTLKLAAQSKKKKSPRPVIKVVESGAEDDVTMSLGLKQTKPKVSYNESISKLKKKPTQQKLQPNVSQSTDVPFNKSEDEEKEEEEKKLDDNSEDNDKTLKNLETFQSENKREMEKINLKKPEETIELKPADDLNETLKKLADTLHLKLEQKEKQLRSRPMSQASKSMKDSLTRIPSQETLRSVKSAPEENRNLITVDLETIQTLKSDIKKISENFKVLHEIIVDKTDLSGKASFRQHSLVHKSRPLESSRQKVSKDIPKWLKSVIPRAYPYNVFTAFQRKMNLKTCKTPSTISKGSSTFAEPISNVHPETEFEALSVPSDRLRSVKEISQSFKSSSCGTLEENYFSMKDDSGSELSSSILDSEKQSLTSLSTSNRHFPHSYSKSMGSKNSITSSIVTELTSRSVHLAMSKHFDSSNSKSYPSKVCNDGENLILVTPDIKLISNDLHQEKLNNYTKNLNALHDTCKIIESEELNNSEKSWKEQKTDSTITELIDNLSENDKSVKSVKSINQKTQNVVQRMEEIHVRRSFFQPEMLHLQFQAELTLLETFQQSLSHFLEAERMKTISEVNKIVYEKAVNSEKLVQKEDQAVQTSCMKESPDKTTSEETDSVKTEINVEEESIKTQKPESPIEETSKELCLSCREISKNENGTPSKDLEVSDFSSGHAGISFQMLDRMIKDEELRSEHQLALIRLREKTLNEKVKAELTFLEMKKRTLKEKGGDEEQNISAIKKKQRGILLKYQSEKEEIERLKKMYKIASEERKIMIRQQKQIQQMQISTNDIIIKLKKREKSPQKKTPLKPKVLKSSDSQSEIPEDIPIMSDSVLSESCSAEESRRSSPTDFDFSSNSNASEDDNEILKRNTKTLQNKISYSLENFKPKKSLIDVEKYPRKRHSVEELLTWTRRLEEKENHLKELEKQTMNAANKAKSKLVKSVKNVKTSMKDRSTSPFQFQESIKTVSEVSPSEATESKKSIEIVESNPKTEMTEKTESIVEKIQSSPSEDIPEQFSKKISTSKTTEYYSESFESPSSSETPKNKPEVARMKSASLEWSHKNIAIKLSLSPRMQSPRRRYSSGSDDSLNLSHTETASEQSDLESRIAALHEQLRKRKLEAERLRREQKKAQRERLKVKEQSLLKQIQAYDAYIQKKKQELEQEYENSNQTIMKPLIKQPKAAEKSNIKRQEPITLNDCEKLGLYARLSAKNKEKGEMILPEKLPDKESDNEIAEQIKESSESIKELIGDSDSIKEQIENKFEEEKSKVESVLDVENSVKESLDPVMTTSISESLQQNDEEGSQSESEDQSVSVKTTVHSPEKQDTEVLETPTGTSEEESRNKQTITEDNYQLDSFESDAEEKEIPESKSTQKSSELSEEEIEIKKTESAVSESIVEEEVNAEEESIVSELVSSPGKEVEDKKKYEKAEKIADSIIMDLVVESLNMFCSKKAEAEKKLAEETKLTLETLSSFLAKEIISEAVDDMIKIYNKKLSLYERPTSPERINSEIRRRINDIISQTNRPRDQMRPQDMMITTYDVFPVTTSPEDTISESAEREKFLQSLTSSKREKKLDEQAFTEGEVGGNGESKAETFGQEWIDDDFELSRTRREAEELRLQQLQIEQEIQQLQAQQEQVPYFYIREIPNKPPPPYTPPGKPLTEIPISESDIGMITLNAVRILTDEMSKGKQIADLEPPWEFYGDAVSEHVKCYKFFLFDLSKHIISDLIEQQEKKVEVLPWMRTREHLSKYKYKKIERTFECLSDFVQKQVLILFGLGKKVTKESLIVRWIKKKRDHVDEILVGESQEEEDQWSQYDEEQVTVKNEVTLAILDDLLDDTTQVIAESKQFTSSESSKTEVLLSLNTLIKLCEDVFALVNAIYKSSKKLTPDIAKSFQAQLQHLKKLENQFASIQEATMRLNSKLTDPKKVVPRCRRSFTRWCGPREQAPRDARSNSSWNQLRPLHRAPSLPLLPVQISNIDGIEILFRSLPISQ